VGHSGVHHFPTERINAESASLGAVAATWGGAPQRTRRRRRSRDEWTGRKRTVAVEETGKNITRTERQTRSEAVKIDASRVRAAFHIDYGKKWCCWWFSTYKVDLDGAYTFQNPSSREEEFVFPGCRFRPACGVRQRATAAGRQASALTSVSDRKAVARPRNGAARRDVRAEAAYRSQVARSIGEYTFVARECGWQRKDEIAAGAATSTCWCEND